MSKKVYNFINSVLKRSCGMIPVCLGASEVVDNISPNSRLRRRILEKQEITAAIGDSCKNFRSSRKALLQKHISVLKMQFI
jgi:hypothetical protein